MEYNLLKKILSKVIDSKGVPIFASLTIKDECLFVKTNNKIKDKKQIVALMQNHWYWNLYKKKSKTKI